MKAPGESADTMMRTQQFSLGRIVSGGLKRAPSAAKIEVRGRGLFCEVHMELEFRDDDPRTQRFFIQDRPVNAILTEMLVNGESIPQSKGDELSLSLPQPGDKGRIESALGEGMGDFLACVIEPESSLRSMVLHYVLPCEVLWHRAAIDFVCESAAQIQFDLSWDLAGLPEATLELNDDIHQYRVQNLDKAKKKISENFELEAGKIVGLRLSLDEKRPASHCLYAPSVEEPDCGYGAVVVVAPVRPQLVRKPARLGIVTEVRSPQAALATRELVSALGSVLNPDDEFCLYALGEPGCQRLVDWTQVSNLKDETLAPLLEPSRISKSVNFWSDLQSLSRELVQASHLVVSSPGSQEDIPESFTVGLPVFCYRASRRANSSTLSQLAECSGGFLTENSLGGPDSFIKRVKLRLSPALISDFRVAWELGQIQPAGIVQVYNDEPSILLGSFKGELPKTINLGGTAPNGKEVAQRVKVEPIVGFNLGALHRHLLSHGGQEDGSVRSIRTNQGITAFCGARPANLERIFGKQSSTSISGPPSIELSTAAVTLSEADFVEDEDEFLAGVDKLTPGDFEEFFSGEESPNESQSENPFLEQPFTKDTTLSNVPTISADQEMEEVSTNPEPEAQGERMLSFSPAGTEGIVLGQATNDLEVGERVPPSEEIFEPPSPTSGPSTNLQSPTPEKPAQEDRSTLSVSPQIPEWVRVVSQMGSEEQQNWLEACSIDTLALALAETEHELAQTFIARLDGLRREAVLVQLEVAKLLSQDERKAASRILDTDFVGR